MPQHKPREFWIDEGLNGLDLGWYKTYVSEFPRKHETSGAKIIHVIEYSAYRKAIDVLKMYRRGVNVSSYIKNSQLAREVLEELGEI